MKFVMHHLKWSLLSSVVGVMSGLAAALFLFLLKLATDFREGHEEIIWALPLAGLFIGVIYRYFGNDVVEGNNLILDEIHDPKKVIPLKMAPLILFSTVITHLFGGSAGREGTAVQMGSSLADQLSTFFKMSNLERKILLVAGAGAGFGAAIGAPWTGMVFGMEVIRIGKFKFFAWFECMIASFVSYYVALAVHAPHSVYPSPQNIDYTIKTTLIVIVFGCLCGLTALVFTIITHTVEKILKIVIRWNPIKPLVMGAILVLLYRLDGTYQYDGLGIDIIQGALQKPVSLIVPLFKGLFTALTIGSGFKGGEFIPLVYMGATLGSALSTWLPINTSLLSSLGFAAVFAGAANTPLACTLMGIEIFGPKIGGYALISCLFSYYCSGHSGIYKTQKVDRHKHHRLHLFLKLLGELPSKLKK